ncbi:hypothetical protein ACP70R_017328 [Stipagrostis hirtigluma subsp. patula]
MPESACGRSTRHSFVRPSELVPRSRPVAGGFGRACQYIFWK